MDAFDFEAFTRMLMRHYPKHEEVINTMEDYWYMDNPEKAFSCAAVLCHRIPERLKTIEFDKGIRAFQEISKRSSPKRKSPLQPGRRQLGPIHNKVQTDMLHSCRNENLDLKAIINELNERDRHNCMEIQLIESRLASWKYYVRLLTRGLKVNNIVDICSVEYMSHQEYKELQELARVARELLTCDRTGNSLDNVHTECDERLLNAEYEYNNLDKAFQKREAELMFLEDQLAEKRDREMLLNADKAKFKDKLREKTENFERLIKDNKDNYERLRNAEYKYDNLVKAYLKREAKLLLMEDQLADKRARETHVNADKSTFEEELKGMTEYCENLIEENKKHCESYKELQKAFMCLELTNTELNRVVGRFQKERKNKKDRVNSDTSFYQETHEDVERKYSEFKERMSTLQNQLHTRNKQITKATKKSDDAERKCEKLQNRIEELEDEIETLNDRNTLFVTQNDNIQVREKDNARNWEASKTLVEKLQREKTEAQKRNLHLQDNLDQQLRVLENVKSKMLHFEEQAQEGDMQLRNALDMHEQNLQHVTSELNCEKSKEQLDDETKTSRTRNESNVAYSVNIQHDIAEADKRFSDVGEIIVSQLTEKITILEEDNSDLKNRLQISKSNDTQYNGIKASLMSMEKENTSMKDRISMLQRECLLYKQELQQARSDITEKETYIENLRKRLEDQVNVSKNSYGPEVTVEMLQLEISESDKRNNELKKQLERTKHELKQVRSQLDEKERHTQDLLKRIDEEASTSRNRNEVDEARFIKIQHEKSEAGKSQTQLKGMVEQQHQELQRIRSDLKQSEEDNRSAKKSITHQHRKLEQHKTELETAQVEIQKKDTRINDLVQRNAKLAKDAEQLPTQLHIIKRELQTAKEKYEDIQKRLNQSDQTSRRLEELESLLDASKQERQDLEESYAKLQKDAEQLQRQFQKTESELRLAQKKNADLQNSQNNTSKNSERLEELEGIVRASKKEKHDLEERYATLQRDAERLQNQFQKTKTELRLAQEKNEDLQNRFSKVAAAQLTHDNPNIADLSDKNRPTKLAEAFSELYDNEWTEAYSAFEDDPQNTTTEEDIVKKLKNVLLTCFSKCTDISTSQIQGIKALLLSPSAGSSMTRPKQELSTEQAKAVNDLRKQTTSFAIENVKQVMAKDNAESRKYPEMKKFIEKCAELCWLMVVQSPPVFIDDRHQTNDRFYKDIFKAYTKGGRVLDYVVWPPVYLHRGGPLLCKGTAQGK